MKTCTISKDMELLGVCVLLVLLMVYPCQGVRFGLPDFTSEWHTITVDAVGPSRINFEHDFGDIPIYVNVQVKSINNPNKDFIFPGLGSRLRDDDHSLSYSGIVYYYNERFIVVSAPIPNDGHSGSAIYTDSSRYWEGPNQQNDATALVRVRAWKSASFPEPDFHSSGDPIGTYCFKNPSRVCFYEKQHNFSDYPSLVIVRIQLKNPGGTLDGFMSDALGANHFVFNVGIELNTYVVHGFDTTSIRVWTDSSINGALYNNDGYGFRGRTAHEGALEIIAWKSTSFPPDLQKNIDLGETGDTTFEMETTFDLEDNPDTDLLVAHISVEAQDGPNSGFRFPGTGGMAYPTRSYALPCCYGGLVYAYTNTTLRLWKPGSVSYGKLICISENYGGDLYAHASNNGRAVMNVWIVSSLHAKCETDSDCIEDDSQCINDTCQCVTGYFESGSRCQRELVCSDDVPYMPELALRQRNNIVARDSKNVVDDGDIRVSWYSTLYSEEQYIMPDSATPPTNGGCGSLYPVYIKGFHPPLNELTEEGIAVDVGVLDNDTMTYSIQVRKCENSVQYRLHPIKPHSFSFCFDSPQIQAMRDFDEAPSNINLSHLNVSVDLRYDTLDTPEGLLYHPFLVFHCEIEHLDTVPETLLYTTYWFIDGSLVDAFGPSSGVTNLSEQQLLDRHVSLGIHIHCGIQLSKTESGIKTDLTKSSPFFAGLKFQSSEISIIKGDTAMIVFEPTVPIGCRYYESGSNVECSKSVYIKPNDDNTSDRLISVSVESEPTEVGVQSEQTCGTHLKAFKSDMPWEPKSYTLTITTVDGTYTGRNLFHLPLLTDRTGHRIWQSYQPDTIAVHVSYSEVSKYMYALCYSHVDPHMRSSDGYVYEHQYEGKYILYRNTNYGIEVQMETASCNNGRAKCACATAIRAGGDVFLIYLCGGIKYIGYTSCTDNDILVVKKRNEFRYNIYTPIGTYIDVKIRPHIGYVNLMNIDIYMAPKDINATEGLCGFYDNNKTNDLRKRNSRDYYAIDSSNRYHYHQDFSEEWSMRQEDRNYLRFPEEPVPLWASAQFCTCNDTVEDEPLAVCSPSISQKNFNCLQYKTQAELTEVKRRLNLTPIDNETVFRRKKREISQVEAETICRDTILNNPTITEFEHRLIGIDLEDVIRECTYDVETENDESWAAVYPESLIQIIDTFYEKDPEYVEQHPEEVSRFKSMSCPMNCSGNGVCNATGDCECTSGFYGSDCSLDITQPLSIDDIYGDGYCDTSDQTSCECFSLQTVNLLDGFYCNVTRVETYINGTQAFGLPEVKSGSYIDLFNGVCCIEGLDHGMQDESNKADIFLTHYDISISNDGTVFGGSRRVTVFDSRCQNGSMQGTDTVLLKGQTCFIGGRCRTEKEKESTDSCLTCISGTYKFSWTNDCSDKGDMYIVPISCGSGLAFLVLISVAYLYYIRHRKRVGKQPEPANESWVIPRAGGNTKPTKDRWIVGVYEL